MNNRIQELMPKPWTFPYPDREMYSKEQMQQLAELIVKQEQEIKRLQESVNYNSWITSPDRMGGSWSDAEIRNSTAWI